MLAQRLIEALERNSEVHEALLTRATRVIEVHRRATPAGPSRSRMAASFLEILLREQGPQRWVDILAAGAEHEHTPATLREIRNEVARKARHSDRHWYWHLKEEHSSG